jgi:sortase A
MFHKFLRAGALLLLSTGLLLTGYAATSWVSAEVFQQYQSWAFDRSLQKPPDPAASAVNTTAGTAKTTERKDESALVGRLEVPRLGLSVMVLEGVEDRELGLGAGHVPGTALPGTAANVVIAGHRDSFFRPLRSVRVNDEIELSTRQGSFRYSVESVHVAEPQDTYLLDPGREPVLTLITCYPFSFIGPAPERFVVRARQIE